MGKEPIALARIQLTNHFSPLLLIILGRRPLHQTHLSYCLCGVSVGQVSRLSCAKRTKQNLFFSNTSVRDVSTLWNRTGSGIKFFYLHGCKYDYPKVDPERVKLLLYSAYLKGGWYNVTISEPCLDPSLNDLYCSAVGLAWKIIW